MRLPLLVVVLVSFVAFSFYRVAGQPFFGFLTLAWNDPWGGQVFVDLVIALSLFLVWARRDAASRGLPFLPYALVTVFLGSMGALAYLIHRELAARKQASAASAA